MNGSRLLTWCKSTVTYAVPPSNRDGSMLLTVPHAGSPVRFAVTLLHCDPPFRVTCTCPSFVPAQMTPFSFGDSAIAKTTPAYSTPTLSGVNPPERICRDLSFRLRSGLITSHVCPPFVVRWTCCDPAYTVL